MSIIEKALNKIVDKPQAVIEPPQSAPIAAETPASSLVERAVATIETKEEAPRQHTSSPQPAPAKAGTEEMLASRQVNIDFGLLRARGLLTNDDERSALAEEYRMIKRPLLANAFGSNPVKNGNLIMVTSSLPGEGKTFTAINLAISIAICDSSRRYFRYGRPVACALSSGTGNTGNSSFGDGASRST